MGGLVDHIFPDVFCVFESPGQTLSGLFLVLRPFLLTGECSLPPSPAPLLLLHPDLLDGGEIDPSPGARHHRRHHTPVESNGFAPEFLFRKHPEPGDRVFLFRLGLPIVRGEGDVPLSRLDRDMERCRTRIRSMGRKGQNPHRELLRPEEKLLGVCLLVISKGEKLGGDPDRLPSVLSLKDGPSGKSGIEPGRGLLPPNRPVTEYLGGNLPEPGGALSDEPGVLLVDGNGRSRKGDRFLGEGPVIPVFGNLGVVDEALMEGPKAGSVPGREWDTHESGCRSAWEHDTLGHMDN